VSGPESVDSPSEGYPADPSRVVSLQRGDDGGDPHSPWDFYNVPVPTLGGGGTMNDRDSSVALLFDVLAVLEYSGTWLGGPPNGTPRDHDDDIDEDTAPDGSITILTDVLLVPDQSVHTCPP
jgi:hypothetical protein